MGDIEHPGGCFGDGVKRMLTVLGGTGYDAENVSRRSLAFEAFAQLVEQSRVFDGDDRLGSEIPD